jgi:transcriptional regulator GlxA family with amidase domain
VCSGAFTLAATGLLDGTTATCHWMHADLFRATHPNVRLQPHLLYVGAGQLWTSAGTAAGIDLCLHLVRQDWGAEVANVIARRMVVPPHREGGQAQFVDRPVPVQDGVRGADDDLRATLEWATRHLDRPLSIETLARRAHMAPRTFARRFRQSMGTTPLQWLQHQRVAEAQRLLETTNSSVEFIAARCGLGGSANLRIHFARVVGTSPNAYRQAFGRAS